MTLVALLFAALIGSAHAASDTATSTATNTPTATPTSTATVTASSTVTATSTATATVTASSTATNTTTATNTPTATTTATNTRTATNTKTSTNTSTNTVTSTVTVTTTSTTTSTNTVTATRTSSATKTSTFSKTATQTATFTWTPTVTPTSQTPVSTFTPVLQPGPYTIQDAVNMLVRMNELQRAGTPVSVTILTLNTGAHVQDFAVLVPANTVGAIGGDYVPPATTYEILLNTWTNAAGCINWDDPSFCNLSNGQQLCPGDHTTINNKDTIRFANPQSSGVIVFGRAHLQ